MKRLNRADREAMLAERRAALEADLRVACWTLLYLQSGRWDAPPPPRRALGSRMPPAEREWWQVYGRDRARRNRPVPTAEQIALLDHWLPTIMFELDAGQRVVLIARLGAGRSWRACGRAADMSHEQARIKYEQALRILDAPRPRQIARLALSRRRLDNPRQI